MAEFTLARGEVPLGEEAEFLKVVCPPALPGTNAITDTVDLPADPRIFQRGIDVMIDLPLPLNTQARVRAGRKDAVPLWIIQDLAVGDAGRTFPSPTIRSIEDETVQVFTQFFLNVHTIHWHGIEPTPMNDGVGHTSFESSASFPYSFATRVPGTFFYHCHKNTVLHFEMGLYGMLIVDPRNTNPALFPGLNPPFIDGQPGLYSADLTAFPQFANADRVNHLVRYDAEAIWAVDSMDSLWHELQHDAFMQQCDANDPANPATFQVGFLNDFRPDIFVISGIVSDPTVAGGDVGTPILAPPVALTIPLGGTGLIRLLNADYLLHETIIGTDVVVVGADGYPFGARGPVGRGPNRFSSAFAIRAGPPIRTTSARRYDLLVHGAAVGEFPVTIKYYDWIRNPDTGGAVLWHTAHTVIRVV
ncbi:MAG: multicopper oxidase domain-containing protein [Deltaproteobacteria bacterium]|nr:multicopper oxidase domain-containing protein [Deltaproteobacteria bacterium]